MRRVGRKRKQPIIPRTDVGEGGPLRQVKGEPAVDMRAEGDVRQGEVIGGNPAQPPDAGEEA